MVVTTQKNIETEALMPHFGVKVRGFDFEPNDRNCDFVYDTLRERKLICFKDADLSNSQLESFFRVVGPLWGDGKDEEGGNVKKRHLVKNFPTITKVSNVKRGLHRSKRISWHSDLCHRPVELTRRPGRVLYGKVIKGKTAPTRFLDTEKALSYFKKSELPDLTVESMAPYNTAWKEPARFPLVYTHPLNGRRALGLSGVFFHKFSELNEEESKKLHLMIMKRVLEKGEKDTYVHSWEEGDCIFYENWGLVHFRNVIRAEGERTLYRLTVDLKHLTTSRP